MKEISEISKEFQIRPASEADFDAALELFNVCALSSGVRTVTMSGLRRPLNQPGFDLKKSSRVVNSRDGKVVGFGIIEDMFLPPVYPHIRGCVHPDFLGNGIGSYLLEWAEAVSRVRLKSLPEELRVALRASTSDWFKPARELFANMGMNIVRNFLYMRVDLDKPLPAPKWPDGIILHTYKDYPDLKAFYRTIDETFHDHWGHIALPEAEGLRQYRKNYLDDPGFDPTLWFLAMEGDKVAAVALCTPTSYTEQDTGYVMDLGVRRQWRKKGLALAMLYHIFAEFRRRGRKYVALDVDAKSLTGATRLYEKAGMIALRNSVLFEKELRPGKDLSTKTIA